MRVTTSNAFEAGLDTLTRRQTELSEAQERLITGKRVNKASDDPAAAARAERALANINRSDASLRAVDASRSVMAQTESSLADAGDLMQEAREVMVAAGNASYSDAERAGLANRLKDIRSQLFAVANRTDGAGSYLFGGQGSTQPPFVETTTGVQFFGTLGEIQGEQDTALPLSTDGSGAWLSARSGNGIFVTSANPAVTGSWISGGSVTDTATYFATPPSDYSIDFTGPTTYDITRTQVDPPGAPAVVVAGATFTPGSAIQIDGLSVVVQGTPVAGDQFQVTPSTANLSIFDVLDQAVATLTTPNRTGAQVAQANGDNLRNIDAAMGNMLLSRSRAGDVLNRIDVETGRIGDQKLASQVERSAAEDLDLVAAVSDFKNQQTGYDAALKSYAMVQRLSLFQYLNG
ncbi:MAG: flagellar hook-associated protein FlgL [Pseudomonadota bacterium]